MAILRAQYALFDKNANPADTYVNTWYFQSGDPPVVDDAQNIAAVLQTFYADTIGAGPVGRLMSPRIANVGHLKVYNMADALPRIPIYETDTNNPGNFGSGTGPGLPTEVAACLSFHAQPTVGIPAASLRGRIYLGPLDTEAVTGSSTLGSMIDAAWRDSCVQSAGRLAGQCDVFGIPWVVFSPTRDQAHVVVGVHMDDAFDTQRRRGYKATTRNSLVL